MVRRIPISKRDMVEKKTAQLKLKRRLKKHQPADTTNNSWLM
jgi:hypothetical protein